MLKVKSQKSLLRLSMKGMRAAKMRNIFSVLAITLTTVLFTTLFTATLQMAYAVEQSNMLMVGSYAHGSFKSITSEQKEQLAQHSSIQKAGEKIPFALLDVISPDYGRAEVLYMDEISAEMAFSLPETGRLPDSQNEAAADVELLALLGADPVIGTEFTVSYEFDDKIVTDTFVLSGYYEKQTIPSVSGYLQVSKEYVQEQVKDYVPRFEGDDTGLYYLDVLFANNKNLAEKINTVASDNGYQTEDVTQENYLKTGVNWGYTNAEPGEQLAYIAVLAVVGVIIMVTGYLIIYNIFQISVVNDIRYYGLLKTIGITKRQIKKILRIQAICLSGLGIPAGMLLGYFMGVQIYKILIIKLGLNMSYTKAVLMPEIFIGAGIFTLATVIISLRKPGKIAGSVSPVEAVKYTETDTMKQKVKRTEKRTKGGETRKYNRILSMALGNLKRGKKKTLLVLSSLLFSILLFSVVYTLGTSFSIERYLDQMTGSDYTVAAEGYFQSSYYPNTGYELPDATIDAITSRDGIDGMGEVYYQNESFFNVTEEQAASVHPYVEGYLDDYNEDGETEFKCNIYGMDGWLLSQLTVLDGELDMEKLASGKYILYCAGYEQRGAEAPDLDFVKAGDIINLGFIEEYDYTEIGELLVEEYTEHTYEVLAVVIMPYNYGVRYSNMLPNFLMHSAVYQTAVSDAEVMSLVFDAASDRAGEWENYMKEYLQNNTEVSYESRGTLANSFNQMAAMVTLVGYLLSAVVGIIGILNYVNAVLTGIITKRTEFAMLRSIGMTVKQLKLLVVTEGVFYGAVSCLAALPLVILLQALGLKHLESMFWFLDVKVTVMPILILLPVFIILGIVLPLAAFQLFQKKTIVEQLRSYEV